MWINCDDLGKTLLIYTKEFYKYGCMIEIGDEQTNIFAQILVDERTKKVDILYVTGLKIIEEKKFEISYQTYMEKIAKKIPEEMIIAVSDLAKNEKKD